MNIDEFWEHINIRSSDECWEWQEGLFADGYGQVRIDDGKFRAHRVAYEISKGRIGEGMYILHTCDNRKCCNPKHLYAGTNRENMKDMYTRNRRTFNRNSGTYDSISLLTEDMVREIRELYKTGRYTQTAIAQHFGIGTSQISKIIRRVAWAHVE